MTLRGKHRRPATNPTPTTRHEVLLNSSGDGLGTPFQEEENGNQQMGLAATVAGTTDIAVGVGGGRRRPRPLAISAADAYQYNVSTILPGRLLIGGEDAGGSEATLRRLGVRGVVNATRDGKEEEEDREGESVRTTCGWVSFWRAAGDGRAHVSSRRPQPSTICVCNRQRWCCNPGFFVGVREAGVEGRGGAGDSVGSGPRLRLHRCVGDMTGGSISGSHRHAIALVTQASCHTHTHTQQTEEARRRGGPCLVYCKKGMSRSGAVVIAYLMKAQARACVSEDKSAPLLACLPPMYMDMF